MTTHPRYPFVAFYGWLIFFGLIVFGGFLLWSYQFADEMLSVDRTRLSLVILVAFLATSLYLGHSAWQLSTQYWRLVKLADCVLTQDRDWSVYNNKSLLNQPPSWAKEYLQLMRLGHENNNNESEPLYARLVEQVHRGHNIGWFLSDVLVRLGLIGTVIGFVLMLGSVYQLKNDDITVLQQLLREMGGGMQVALYTTLTGIGTGLLISVQCQWLDRCADSLISRIIELPIRSGQSRSIAPDNG